MKKSRRRAQRAKSALESSDSASKHSSERTLRSRPSLPARPKLHSVINKDTGVSIVRPWSDQTICKTKQMLESDEITVIDFEVMNNVAKAYQTRNSKQDRSKLNQPSSDSVPVREPWYKGFNPDLVSSSETFEKDNGEHSLARSSKSELETNEDNICDEEPCSNGIRSKGDRKKKRSSSYSAAKCVSNMDKPDENISKNVEHLRSRFRNRNAISEERYVEKENPRTSSQPAIKVGSSMFPSSSDNDSDISLGEIVVVPLKQKKMRTSSDTSDKSSNKVRERTKVNKKTKHSERKPRPNSAEFVKSKESNTVTEVSNKNKVKINSSPTLNSNSAGTPEKPKDVGFARVSKMLTRAASDKSVGKVPSDSNSQQSSVIGLDWLFSTDSDSSGKNKPGPAKSDFSLTCPVLPDAFFLLVHVLPTCPYDI